MVVGFSLIITDRPTEKAKVGQKNEYKIFFMLYYYFRVGLGNTANVFSDRLLEAITKSRRR